MKKLRFVFIVFFFHAILFLVAPGANDYQQTNNSPASDQQSVSNEKEAAPEGSAKTEVDHLFFDKIDELKTKLSKMREEITILHGEQRAGLTIAVRETEFKLRKLFGQLVDYVNDDENKKKINQKDFNKLRGLLAIESNIIKQEINYVKKNIDSLFKGQNQLGSTELFERKQEVSKRYSIYDGLLNDMLANIKMMESVGIKNQDDIDFIDDSIKTRTLIVSSEIKLVREKDKDLHEQLANASKNNKEKIKTQIITLEEYKEGLTDSLNNLIELMHARDIDATEYSELLIKSTGQISNKILDKDVVSSLASHTLESSKEWLVKNSLSLVFKTLTIIFILAAFIVVSLIVKKIVRAGLERRKSKGSHLMGNFVISMSGKFVLLIGIIVALSQLGLKVGPLLAGLGIAGFIVGFALQDVLSNFASGIMILIYQPFDVGDTIEVPEVSGYVQNMNLVSTKILTFDNQRLVVPNNKIWGNIIRNIHAERNRRVDLVFGVGYEVEIDHAERVLHEIVKEHPLVLERPKPNIKLHALNESSVDFIVRPWTKSENYWEVYWDITRTVKKRFDEEKISIPFPQRDVHIKQS